MIEYRCVCGGILSALESQRDQSVPCRACGHVTELPPARSKGRSSVLVITLGIVGAVCLLGGLFFGVLLPEIQRVRVAAFRMQEYGHFKMIGVVMHHYAEAQGELPR